MKKILLTPFILFGVLNGADDLDILNDTKTQILNLKKEQIKQKKQTNKLDIFDPLNIQGNVNRGEADETSKDYSISLSQQIFNFGGISTQLEYADILEKFEFLDLEIQKKDDLTALYSLVLDTKINELEIKQNSLNLENSKIEIKNKTSRYKQGDLDISDLNNAIISKNQLSDTIKKLNLTRLSNMNEIKKYTSKEYSKINIPELKILSKEFFLEKSANINLEKTNINLNKSLYDMKKSDYYPIVKLNGSYGINDEEDLSTTDYYNYGISVSIPLSLKSSSDIEQSKIDYLVSKKELADKINELSLEYDSSILKIDNFKERIQLAKEDIELYEQLLLMNKQEYEAGYKTFDDVVMLENSKKIRELDIKIYDLNIKKIILVEQLLEIL